MGARSSKQERQQHRQVMGAETPEAPLGPSLDEIGAARRQAQAAKERVLQQQGARPGARAVRVATPQLGLACVRPRSHAPRSGRGRLP